MMIVVIRILALLQMIPEEERGQKTISELLELLEKNDLKISRRMLQRILNQISGYMPLSCELKGRTNHWYWLKGRKPEINGFFQG